MMDSTIIVRTVTILSISFHITSRGRCALCCTSAYSSSLVIFIFSYVGYHFLLKANIFLSESFDIPMFHMQHIAIQGGSKKVSCCTVSTAYFFLSHPVYQLTWFQYILLIGWQNLPNFSSYALITSRRPILYFSLYWTISLPTLTTTFAFSMQRRRRSISLSLLAETLVMWIQLCRPITVTLHSKGHW